MTEAQLNKIENSLATMRDNRSKAQGRIETIVEGWKASFGGETIIEAQAHLDTLRGRAEKMTTRMEVLFEELQSLVPDLA